MFLKSLNVSTPIETKTLFISQAQNIAKGFEYKAKIKSDKEYGYRQGDKLPKGAKKQPIKSDLAQLTLTEEFNYHA